MRGGIGTLTGQNVEQRIAEYSELYTQVLLGVHDDVKRVELEMASFRPEVERLKALEADTASFRSEVEALNTKIARIQATRNFTVAALILSILAVIGLGGVVWAMI